MWQIVQQDGAPFVNKSFDSRAEAEHYRKQIPELFRESTMIRYHGSNPYENRLLNEGLLRGDLDGILLPKISIDEYVPSDPESTATVIAFFLKGVPEAVVPFRDFCRRCNGIIDVDYGDSDTIPNTSIVYVEMARETLKLSQIVRLIEQVSVIANMEIGDFSLSFPTATDPVPYNPEAIRVYYKNRDLRTNMIAQKKAEKEAREKIEQALHPDAESDEELAQDALNNSDQKNDRSDQKNDRSDQSDSENTEQHEQRKE